VQPSVSALCSTRRVLGISRESLAGIDLLLSEIDQVILCDRT
jgi:hypothetical protein